MKLSPPIGRSDTLPGTGVDAGAPPRRAAARRIAAASWRPRGPMAWFALLVLLPTLLVGAYYAVMAADLYQSEARFLVRGRGGASAGAAGGIAGMLAGGGNAGAALRPGAEEARAVGDFVDSLDAIAGLRQRLDLVGVWRRPEADRISRLWWEEPEAERLLRYYRRRVTIEYDVETGITALRVLAYRPGDAREVAEALLGMSEALVNRFSARTSEDTLRVAREEVQIAERRVVTAREALTSFREREQALDPTRSAGAAVETIARLDGALAQARAELQEKRSFMRPDNPQIQVLNNRIAALSAQIGVERARLTRGGETLTQQLSGYERLQLEREFAERQLSSAIASLETARADAQRQQVFLMRVVEPNLPERALFPRALFNTLTVLVGLAVLYGIGWLLVAGAREHAS
jgi:capsular polysaccharide transport system permease protein